MDHFPSNWEYCWAENNVQRTSLCRMLVDHYNAYHYHHNYAGCWFQPIPFQKCQTIKNWFAPLIKTSSLCFSEQLSNIINENRVVGYHIKSKSWISFNFEKVKVLRKCLNFILLSVEVEQVGHLYQFSEPVSPNLTFALPIFKIWLCLPQFHSFASQIFFPLLNWKYAAPSCQLSTFNAPQEQVREITHIFDIFTNRQ